MQVVTIMTCRQAQQCYSAQRLYGQCLACTMYPECPSLHTMTSWSACAQLQAEYCSLMLSAQLADEAKPHQQALAPSNALPHAVHQFEPSDPPPYLQEACAAFAESIAELAPAELLHMGMDSAGSRSLEAFLGSEVSAKAKMRVIRKLAGSYARLGSSPGGSHVAQACYRTAVSSALKCNFTKIPSCVGSCMLQRFKSLVHAALL